MKKLFTLGLIGVATNSRTIELAQPTTPCTSEVHKVVDAKSAVVGSLQTK